MSPLGLLASLIIVTTPLDPIQPVTPPPQSRIFTVTDQAIPWTIPTDLPNAATDGLGITIPSVTMDSFAHSVDYDDKVTGLDDALTSISSPLTDIRDQIDVLFSSGDVPDMSDPDFDTGFSNAGTPLTAYDMVDAFGASLGTAFLWARATATLPSVASSQTVFAIIFLNVAWVLLIIFIKVLIQIIDMVTSLLAKLAEIANILTGPLT